MQDLQRAELDQNVNLAMRGKYKCRACGKVGDQSEALVVALRGAPLLTACPDCIPGRIIIEVQDGYINVSSSMKQNRIVLPERPILGYAPATPKMSKMKF